jgi:hypothetical protein
MKTKLKPNTSAEELAFIKNWWTQANFNQSLPYVYSDTQPGPSKTLESIAEFLNLSLSSVIRYVKRFNVEGLESLLRGKKNEICKIVYAEKPKTPIGASEVLPNGSG